MSIGNDSAHILAAGLVLAERFGSGGGVERAQAEAPISAVDVQRSGPRIHDDHEFPAFAGETPFGCIQPGNHQRLPVRQVISFRRVMIVDATMTHVLSLIENKESKRNSGIYQAKKGSQSYLSAPKKRSVSSCSSIASGGSFSALARTQAARTGNAGWCIGLRRSTIQSGLTWR